MTTSNQIPKYGELGKKDRRWIASFIVSMEIFSLKLYFRNSKQKGSRGMLGAEGVEGKISQYPYTCEIYTLQNRATLYLQIHVAVSLSFSENSFCYHPIIVNLATTGESALAFVQDNPWTNEGGPLVAGFELQAKSLNYHTKDLLACLMQQVN